MLTEIMQPFEVFLEAEKNLKEAFKKYMSARTDIENPAMENNVDLCEEIFTTTARYYYHEHKKICETLERKFYSTNKENTLVRLVLDYCELSMRQMRALAFEAKGGLVHVLDPEAPLKEKQENKEGWTRIVIYNMVYANEIASALNKIKELRREIKQDEKRTRKNKNRGNI